MVVAARPASIQATPTFVYDTIHEEWPVVTFHHGDHAERYGATCVDCHGGDDCGRCHDAIGDHPALDFLSSCCGCHSQSNCGFCHKADAQPPFDHTITVGWSLEPYHDGVACAECHGSPDHFASPSGECRACHGELMSDGFDHRAMSRGRDCLDCHDDVSQASAGVHHEHEPFARGCAECHDPNVTETAPYLREPVPDLCFSCHEAVAQCFDGAAVVHGPASEKASCTTCHRPHGADAPRLLRRAPGELCLGCHDRSITTPSGRSLRNIASLLAACPDHHGPVRDSDCGACHQPHASANPRLLRASYPGGFYASFEPGGYDLCFDCHDRTLAEADAPGTTGFCDGTRNLHRLHVNQRKGRTCGCCHDVHAAAAPFHIREAVPFEKGGWALAIGYEQTTEGGRCAPGCHTPEAYRRERGQGRKVAKSADSQSRHPDRALP
jgi:predicted CXXCH cytochrome family protein